MLNFSFLFDKSQFSLLNSSLNINIFLHLKNKHFMNFDELSFRHRWVFYLEFFRRKFAFFIVYNHSTPFVWRFHGEISQTRNQKSMAICCPILNAAAVPKPRRIKTKQHSNGRALLDAQKKNKKRANLPRPWHQEKTPPTKQQKKKPTAVAGDAIATTSEKENRVKENKRKSNKRERMEEQG